MTYHPPSISPAMAAASASPTTAMPGPPAHPPTAQAMLAAARARANKAVLMDGAQNLEAALEAYHDAVRLLSMAMDRMSGVHDVHRLRDIRTTYEERIAALEHIQQQQQQQPPTPKMLKMSNTPQGALKSPYSPTASSHPSIHRPTPHHPTKADSGNGFTSTFSAEILRMTSRSPKPSSTVQSNESRSTTVNVSSQHSIPSNDQNSLESPLKSAPTLAVYGQMSTALSRAARRSESSLVPQNNEGTIVNDHRSNSSEYSTDNNNSNISNTSASQHRVYPLNSSTSASHPTSTRAMEGRASSPQPPPSYPPPARPDTANHSIASPTSTTAPTSLAAPTRGVYSRSASSTSSIPSYSSQGSNQGLPASTSTSALTAHQPHGGSNTLSIRKPASKATLAKQRSMSSLNEQTSMRQIMSNYSSLHQTPAIPSNTTTTAATTNGNSNNVLVRSESDGGNTATRSHHASRNSQSVRSNAVPSQSSVGSNAGARSSSSTTGSNQNALPAPRIPGVMSRSFSPAHRRNKSSTPSVRSIDGSQSSSSNSSSNMMRALPVDMEDTSTGQQGQTRIKNGQSLSLSLSMAMGNNNKNSSNSDLSSTINRSNDILDTGSVHRRSSSESARSNMTSGTTTMEVNRDGSLLEQDARSAAMYARRPSLGRVPPQGHRTAASLQNISYGRTTTTTSTTSTYSQGDVILSSKLEHGNNTPSINEPVRINQRKSSHPSIELHHTSVSNHSNYNYSNYSNSNSNSSSSNSSLSLVPSASSSASRFTQRSNRIDDGNSSPRLDNIPDIDEDTETEEDMDGGRARADTAPSLAYAIPESASDRNSKIDVDQPNTNSATTLEPPTHDHESAPPPSPSFLVTTRRPSIVVPIDEMAKPALADVAPFMFASPDDDSDSNPVNITVIRGRKQRPSVDMGSDNKGRSLYSLTSPPPLIPTTPTSATHPSFNMSDSNRSNTLLPLSSTTMTPATSGLGSPRAGLFRSPSNSSIKVDSELSRQQRMQKRDSERSGNYVSENEEREDMENEEHLEYDEAMQSGMPHERIPQRKRSLAQLFHRRKPSGGGNGSHTPDVNTLGKSLPDDMNTIMASSVSGSHSTVNGSSTTTAAITAAGHHPPAPVRLHGHSPANSVHSLMAGPTSLLANTIAVGRRNRIAQQLADGSTGTNAAGRLPHHFATLPTRGNAVNNDETNRRVVITSSAVPRRTHNHGRPSLSIALQITRNTITGGPGTRNKFSNTSSSASASSSSSTSNQSSNNTFTLFDVMREEPDPNTLLEAPPQAVELRSFWLMRCLERSITSGGYLTSRLYIPRSIWMTTGVKLTAIDTKIQACERLRDRLEKMAAVDLEDSDNAVIVLDELDEELHNIQNQLARKLDFIKESKRQKQSGLGLKSLGLGLKSMERMHANMTKDKVEDAGEYMDALVNLFRACQLLDHWLRYYSGRASCKEREHALQRLHRASDFMRSVICAFVIRDLGLLYDKYSKRIHEWMID